MKQIHDDYADTLEIFKLTRHNPKYGYRTITVLMNMARAKRGQLPVSPKHIYRLMKLRGLIKKRRKPLLQEK